MRILIINFFYAPVVDAHTYRWEQIARHWVAEGNSVDVITNRVIGCDDQSVDFGVNVTRVGLFPRPLNLGVQGKVSSNSLKRRLRSRLINMLRPIYRTVYWPDALWHWIPSVINEVSRRDPKNYDLVISYYPFMAAHIAGAILKQRGGPGITWIADYGDPFSISTSMQPNNFRLFRRLNLVLERAIAKRVTSMVFTNESTAEAYRRNFPEANIIVLPHVANVGALRASNIGGAGDDSVRGSKARRMILVYVGSFHRNIREPGRLLDLVRHLNNYDGNKFLLRIYGPDNGFNLAGLAGPDVEYMGAIPRALAIEVMQHADVLVNVENSNCVMTPSKIVEYIATGRPIINISTGGECDKALKEYIAGGHAFSVGAHGSTSAAIASLRKFLGAERKQTAAHATIDEILDGYSLQHISSQYLKLANKHGKPS